jgi:hypothetical protein
MAEPTEGTTTKQPETDATAAGDGQGEPTPSVTFTQEQLEAIVKDRLVQAKRNNLADLLAQLGIEDIETAKKTLAEADTARKAQMSELETAQAEIAEAKAAAQKAAADAEVIRATAAEALLKAAIISRAGDLEDPMDAWQFVDRSKIEAQDDGTYKGIDEALKELAESKPYLVKVAVGGNQGPGTPARRKPQTIVEKLLTQQQEGSAPRTAEDLRPNISF